VKNSPKRWDVVGIGHCALDLVALVPKRAPKGSKTEVRDLILEGGGPVATAMVTLARLGRRVTCVGAVGDDMPGKLIVDGLAKELVDTSAVVVQPGRQSKISLVWVEEGTGDRTIFWSRGTVQPLGTADADLSPIDAARVLHVDGLEMPLSLEAARRANRVGVEVVLDAGSERNGMEELAASAGVVAASEPFAITVTGVKDPGDMVKRLHAEFGTRWTIVTLGGRGSVGTDGGEPIWEPAPQVDVVDTTGAGDVFHGALVFAILRRWPLDVSLRFSNTVAAMKCRRLGGRAGIPSLAELRARLPKGIPL
jgi:sulfofructose kinase